MRTLKRLLLSRSSSALPKNNNNNKTSCFYYYDHRKAMITTTMMSPLKFAPKTPAIVFKNNNNKHATTRRGTMMRTFASYAQPNMSSDMQQQQRTAPPATVEWDSTLANSVTLIGNCGGDPELRVLPSGKMVCEVSIAVSQGRKAQQQQQQNDEENDGKTAWYTVVAWDEEAVRLNEHVRKGNSVCVQGRLTTDTWVCKQTGQNRSKAKVVLNQFSFVARGESMVSNNTNGVGYEPMRQQQQQQQFSQGGYEPMQQQQQQQRSPPPPPSGDGFQSPKDALWRSVFDAPDRWWDNRENKRNPRAPDFKHKDTGEGLWLTGRDTPPWVMERMMGGAAGAAAGAMATGQDDSDGYYGASKGTAYNNPYGNQEPAVNANDYSQAYDPNNGGYEPAQEWPDDEVPF